MPEPSRRTQNSSLTIDRVHPKALKLIQGLDESDRSLLLEKINRPIIATDYKKYRGDHIRKYNLYHTHISKNLMFNFLLEGGEGILLFVGLHKEAERHADSFHQSNAIRFEDCLPLKDCGLLINTTPTEATPEPVQTKDNSMESASDPHPDLRDIAGLLQTFIHTTAQSVAEEATAHLHKHYDAIVEQFDHTQSEQKQAFQQLSQFGAHLQSVRDKITGLDSLAQKQQEFVLELQQLKEQTSQSTQAVQVQFAQQTKDTEQRVHELRGQLAPELADLKAQLHTLSEKLGGFLSTTLFHEELSDLRTHWEAILAEQQAATQSHSNLQQLFHESQSQLRAQEQQLEEKLALALQPFQQLKPELEARFLKFSDQVEKSFHFERQQAEAKAKQLTDAERHIAILSEQIASQSQRLALAETERGELRDQLTLLEAKFVAWTSQKDEPKGLAKLFSWFGK